MLAGLLFAIEKAADHPSRLAATLPFSGTTLIEHQARQLMAAGAGQIVVIAEKHSPDLLGAVHRIGRRGVSVDVALGAVEAATVLHPLACVVMLADGLVTTDLVVRLLADEEGEALIVVPANAAPPSFERVGGADAWAGAARLDARRLADLAELPADYDPQSTLLRLVEAGGATRLPLPEAATGERHGIERSIAALAQRERRVVAASFEARPNWFDRFVAAPLVRTAMPPLIARGIETAMVASLAGMGAVAGLMAIVADRPGLGLLLVMVAMLIGAIGIAMADLRDERSLRRGLQGGIQVTAAAAVLVLAWRCGVLSSDGTALPVAIALIVATALVERAGAASAHWWGGAPSCVLIVAAATWLGRPLVGLILAAFYAIAMLAGSIEALRRDLARL